jgi:predicted DCC family thiol-disulfide oxidoreductase YuxK
VNNSITKEHIVLFDGVCNFCNNSVQFILRKEKKPLFKFAALQSEIGKKLMQQFSSTSQLPDSIIYIRDGKVFSKSGAALRICLALKGAWPLLSIFLIVPYFVRDFVYDVVARNRYRWWGKRESCFLPTPEIRSRFLDSSD